MRALGEQWIEEIDGKRHMVVEMKSDKEHGGCQRCIFNGGHGTCVYPEDDCPVQNGHHIKDLGPVNEDGCLPSPWGGYPKVIRVGKPNFVTYFNVSYVQKIEKGKCSLQVQVIGKTKQEAIDAWNRRV